MFGWGLHYSIYLFVIMSLLLFVDLLVGMFADRLFLDYGFVLLRWACFVVFGDFGCFTWFVSWFVCYVWCDGVYLVCFVSNLMIAWVCLVFMLWFWLFALFSLLLVCVCACICVLFDFAFSGLIVLFLRLFDIV